MTKQNESFAQLLKMEIMERYGLREDQVRLELSVSTTDELLAREILWDFDRATEKSENYLPKNSDCDSVYGEQINQVWVHRKNGFYGTYVNEGVDNDE